MVQSGATSLCPFPRFSGIMHANICGQSRQPIIIKVQRLYKGTLRELSLIKFHSPQELTRFSRWCYCPRTLPRQRHTTLRRQKSGVPVVSGFNHGSKQQPAGSQSRGPTEGLMKVLMQTLLATQAKRFSITLIFCGGHSFIHETPDDHLLRDE